MSTRILIVDDQRLMREGLRTLLELEPDFDVAGEAGDGAAALEAYEASTPDIVLMDIRMPVMDGLEATRRLGADSRTASCKVVILTTFDLDEYVFEALRLGASGFLLKDTRRDQLIDAIRVVAAGEALLSPRITRTIIEEFTSRPSIDTAKAKLLETITERERDVLLSVARGASNAEIAEALFMGAGTVKTHVSHLLTKLDARDRAQLVVFAYESGFIRAGRDE